MTKTPNTLFIASEKDIYMLQFWCEAEESNSVSVWRVSLHPLLEVTVFVDL